jgi:hypothetical protein
MTETIEGLLVLLVYLTDIFIIGLFFFFYKKTVKNKALIIITLYCFIDLAVNSIVEFFPFKNVSILYSFFTLAEFILFSYFIYLNIENKAVRQGILILHLLFTIFIIVYQFFANFRSVDSVPIGIETILILILSFYYLYEQMSNMEKDFIYNTFHFWVITGMMIYLAGSFFIYIFANQVDKETLHQFWFLTNVFYILKNILFAIAILIFLKQSARQKNPSPKNFQPYLN